MQNPTRLTEQLPSFSPANMKELTIYDLYILEELAFLCKLKARTSKTGARYATPGELYLSRKVGIARENISRHVSKLRRLGILLVTPRSRVNGKRQTNLYRIVSWVWFRLGKITASLKSPTLDVQPPESGEIPVPNSKSHSSANHVTLPSHKLFSMREDIISERAKGAPAAIKDLLTAWMGRGSDVGTIPET